MNNRSANHPHDESEEPQAPRKLASALRELPRWSIFVPPAVDHTVLQAARRHLAKRPPPVANLFHSWLAWPALAAACLVVLGSVYYLAKPAGLRERLASPDLNRDGQVDILDAFQLARQLQSGQKPGAGLDLNGDGVVDGRDVQVLGARAVQLEKGGRS